MKLSKMSWYADALRVPFTRTKGLQTVGYYCELCASACADPALSVYVAYHFVAELLLFPVASTLLYNNTNS
ncbi:unnamed protein product [Staurois parvus]|uniref:Uncharacterized protein n=1 Tax=Staurois parvus TaxID=386267 RepID=A0ABN9B0Y5_9NEOB|nr:unnamed protein product [Staurois parvus]